MFIMVHGLKCTVIQLFIGDDQVNYSYKDHSSYQAQTGTSSKSDVSINSLVKSSTENPAFGQPKCTAKLPFLNYLNTQNAPSNQSKLWHRQAEIHVNGNK